MLTKDYLIKLLDFVESLTSCKPITGFGALDVSRDSNIIELGPNELRHTACLIFYKPARDDSLSQRCTVCTKYRHNVLSHRLRRLLSTQSTPTPTRLNHRYMSHDTLSDRAKKIQNQLSSQKKENIRLRDKLDNIIRDGVSLDKSGDSNASNESVRDIVVDALTNKSPPKLDSELKNLLWDQQMKQASAKGTHGMRWHPMVIRWALTLKSISASGYNYLKNSGFLALPHESTLNRYAAYKKISYGVDMEAIEDLSKNLGVNRDVCLMFDEIKIKDQLVYEKGTGKMIGYVELGDINKALASLDTETAPATASHVLCFMGRDIKSKTCTPVAHYATNAMTADQVYHMFWEVVAAMELMDIRVRSCVADGASINRRFILLHKADYPTDEITHRARNIYSTTPRDIYFVSDVPHLIKTTCNCFENSHANLNTRNLRVSSLRFNVV